MNRRWNYLIGIVCSLILIFMVCFLCCRRAETIVTKKPTSNSITANGDITHHIVMEPEQQKTLLTAVNPVQKPPRKYDSSPQSDGGGAEMTELNRNLLDDMSAVGKCLIYFFTSVTRVVVILWWYFVYDMSRIWRNFFTNDVTSFIR